jgi:hypothetical protein
MPCENYREALIEAAATGAAPSRELRSHLDACASCSAAFNEELLLFAAMDSGVRATANSEVPASLLPHVRARLNERPATRRFWIPAWAAVAAVAALVFAIVLVRGIQREPAKSIPVGGSVASRVVPDLPKSSAVVAAEKTSPRLENLSPRPKAVRRRPAVEEAFVLLPADQKETVDSLLAGLRRSTVVVDDLPIEKPAQPFADLKVLPLGVSPIEMKPLEDVSGNSDSENEPTKD